MTTYSYHFLTLSGGAPAFAKALAADPAKAGGRPLGLFTPQLGWESAQAALLVQGSGGDVGALPGVVGRQSWTLTPILRPRAEEALKPGGIHVHRWFEVDAANAEEFVALSGHAWPDFEAGFDANIFGLFLAQPAPADRASLLLITRYASHGVWEDSRDPTTEAMQIFARRRALTRNTRAASTLLTPL